MHDVVTRLRLHIAAAGDPAVCIATVLVSDDPRDLANARRKHRKAEEAGMRFRHSQFSAAADQGEVQAGIDALAGDPSVHGVFVQLPLPRHLDAFQIVDRIPLQKDIDGLSRASLGALVRGNPTNAPATPSGILELLARGGVDVQAAHVVVVGRSFEIARALALLIAVRGAASVTLIDPDSSALRSVTKKADVLVTAAERPGMITAEYVKAGAAVVDAGYNRTPSGIAGDLDPSVEDVAGAIVPMPGGIGPATIAVLLQHTWTAYAKEGGVP